MKKFLAGFIGLFLIVPFCSSQSKELRWFLSKDSAQFVKLNFTNQAWIRYAENNPASAVAGSSAEHKESETFDIGLRRTRFQLFGQITPKVFFYTQFGMNNFNYLSARKTGFFIHDALGEIIICRQLSFGAGLTAWTGFSRFSSPGVASIMALDAPLFLQATNDANDQFLRKLSVYAKGKLGRLDYRLVVSKPMEFAYSSIYRDIPPGIDAQFSPYAPSVQESGYISYQFLDEESNLTPYQAGTYLGKKRVFNIGAGVQYQQDAMWLKEDFDTSFHDMLLGAIDLYYDAPIGSAKTSAISIYVVGTYYDFGNNYVRNLGVMNTTDSLYYSGQSFNGTGVSFPMVGTGNSAYLQVGYLSPQLSRTRDLGRLMPYVAVQYSQYLKLNDDMLFIDLGCSWYLDESRSKLTFGIQNRPVFDKQELTEISRLNSFILQYQVSI